jgi:molybdopterin-containing oxidoreductase family membrane subunit
MDQTAVVLGIFVRLEALHGALSQLRDHGWSVLDVYSPVPSHRIEEAVMPGQSAVRIFTLAGGTVGAVGGIYLAIWSSLKWGLITGGKPVVSVPPFVIIGFELTLLLGALATVAGFLVTARLVRFRRDPYYDPRFSQDHFGLLIAGPSDQQTGMADFLKQAGAKEVRTVDET